MKRFILSNVLISLFYVGNAQFDSEYEQLIYVNDQLKIESYQSKQFPLIFSLKNQCSGNVNDPGNAYRIDNYIGVTGSTNQFLQGNGIIDCGVVYGAECMDGDPQGVFIFDWTSLKVGTLYSFDFVYDNFCFSDYSNITGTIQYGVTPLRPGSLFVYTKEYKQVDAIFEGEDAYLDNFKHVGWEIEYQYSFDNLNWTSVTTVGDQYINFKIPLIPSNYGVSAVLYLRSRNHATIANPLLAYSPWEKNSIHVYKKPTITITPNSGDCLAENGNTTTLSFQVIGLDLIDASLKPLKVLREKVDEDGGTYDVTLLTFNGDLTLTTDNSGDGIFEAGETSLKYSYGDPPMIRINNTYALKQPPAIISTSSNSRCDTGSVTLSAVAGRGVLNWYDALYGGNPIGSGDSLETPSISSTTNYYVDVTGDECTSTPRIAVTATVNIPSKLILTSGIQNPEVCIGSSITSIVFKYGGSATNASVSNLPSGLVATVDTVNKTVTINGKPTVSGTYTVTTSGHTAPCTAAIIQGTVSCYATPTPATVASGTLSYCGARTSRPLGGNTPSVGSGMWSKVSGPGTVTFSAATSGSSTATVSTYGVYKFRWTISNGTCTASTADVTVSYYETPTPATVASATLSYCGARTSGPLGGNTPSVGSGTWSKVSGPGTVTFSAATSGSSTATVSTYGAYVLRWTISNGTCTASTVDVNVTFAQSATVASGTLSYCGALTSGPLGGNTPSVGSGTWSKVSGPGTVTFSAATSGSSTAMVGSYGVYVLRWTIVNGTCSSSKDITVSFFELPNPIISFVENSGVAINDGVTCGGDQITLSASGGSTYKWSTNQTTPSIMVNPTSTTNYSVEVTDINGCKVSASKIITVNPLPNVATGSDVERCDAGEIILSAIPGLNGNTIRWYDVASNGSPIVVNATLLQNVSETKSYYAESYNTETGCIASQRKEIIAYVVSQANIVNQPEDAIICDGSNISFMVVANNAKSYQWEVSKDGGINWDSITESGNDPTYTNWNTNALLLSSVTHSQNNFKYKCLVKSTPCNDVYSDVATLHVSSTQISIIRSNLVCKGDNSGKIEAVLKNGIAPYTVVLKKGTNIETTLNGVIDTVNFNNLSAGIYSIEVSDFVLCGASYTNIEIEEPFDNLTASMNFKDPNCYSSSDGFIIVESNGGWGGNTYSLNDSINNIDGTFFNLKEGNYNVIVTDKNGCSVNLEKQLTQPSKLEIYKNLSIDPKCYGWSNGEIYLGATGGTKPYTFKMGAIEKSDSSFIGLNAGTFNCIVMDTNKCQDSIEILLSQLDPINYSLIKNDYNNYNIICNGDVDSIKIIPSGGEAPYTIEFQNHLYDLDVVGISIKNLVADNYSFTIVDNVGCELTDDIIVSEPPALEISSLNFTDVKCFGMDNGSVTVEMNGGVKPYLFTLKNDEGNTVCQKTGNMFSYDTLIAGNYSIDIADLNNCMANANFTIKEPHILQAEITTKDVSCFNVEDGNAVATVSGGTMPYFYQWLDENNSEVGNTSILSNVKASNWSVKITDSNGCSGVAAKFGFIEKQVVINNPTTPLILGTEVTPVACNGGSTGSIKILPDGGWGKYEYSADGVTYNSSDLWAGLSSGIYDVYVKDSMGCIVNNSIAVNEQTSLEVSCIVNENVSCFGANDGKIEISAYGGVPEYKYFIGNTEVNSMVNNLSAGNYSITVTDANECNAFADVEIVQPELIVFTSRIYNSTCGSSNGSIKIIPVGGSGNYVIQWFDGTNVYYEGDSLSGVPSGKYYFRIVDDSGCSREFSQDISDEGGPNLNIIQQKNPLCNNASNGVIELEITSGTLPIKYKFLSNGIIKDSVEINSIPFTNLYDTLGQGSYSFSAIDFNGCSTNTSITLTSPDVISISTTKKDVVCRGSSSGSATVSVVGGTAPYSIQWFNSENNLIGTNKDLIDVKAGIYTVKVFDTNGCPTDGKTATVEINEPQYPLAFNSIVKLDVKCFDENSGNIVISASGGWGTYKYSDDGINWSTTSRFDNLIADEYTIYVSDKLGCIIDSTIKINQNPVLELNISGTDITCNGVNDGIITLAANGGTGSYKYSIDNGISYVDYNLFVNKIPGTYTAKVKDSNGCLVSGNFMLSQPDKLTLQISSLKTLKCYDDADGEIILSASGGVLDYKYSKNSDAFTNNNVFTNLSSGNYIFSVKDENGCMATITPTISNPPKLALAISSYTNIFCNGGGNGEISVEQSGGTPNYKYSIDGLTWQNETTFTGLVAGNYNVSVTDANYCKANVNITLSQPLVLNLTIASYTNITCYGKNDGKVGLLASGGTSPYKYSSDGNTWFDNTTFSNLSPANYTFSVKDSKGCIAIVTKQISEPNALAISTISKANPACYGSSTGNVVVGVNGGVLPYTYSKLMQTKESAGYSKSFEGTNTFSNLIAGTYSFIVKDKNSCTSTINETLVNPIQVSVNVASVSNVTCNGLNNGVINVNGNGGTPLYTYSIDGTTWQPSTTFSGLGVGNYIIKVKDSNGCTNSVSSNITQPNVLQFSLTSFNNVTCKGDNNGNVSLLAAGGVFPYTYSSDGNIWGSSSLFTGLFPSSYTFKVKDSNGCVKSVNQQITEPDELLISPVTVKDPTCSGYSDGRVDVSVTGGTIPYVYSWSNGSSLYTTGLVNAGNYNLNVTDKNNCQKNTSYILEYPDKITLDIPASEIICSNQALMLDAGYADLNHQWTSDNGFTSSNRIVTLTKAGNYYLTVTDSKGCFNRDTLHLTLKDIDIDADFLLPDKASVADTVVAVEISWPMPDSIAWTYSEIFNIYKTDSYSVYLIPQEEGSYTIGLVTYLMGCHQTVEKNIVIDPNSGGKKEITDELNVIKDVFAFPNPNNGHFSILVDLNREADVVFELYSIYGKKLILQKASGLNSYKFDVNIKQTMGIYLVRISSGNEYRNIRVVIE